MNRREGWTLKSIHWLTLPITLSVKQRRTAGNRGRLSSLLSNSVTLKLVVFSANWCWLKWHCVTQPIKNSVENNWQWTGLLMPQQSHASCYLVRKKSTGIKSTTANNRSWGIGISIEGEKLDQCIPSILPQITSVDLKCFRCLFWNIQCINSLTYGRVGCNSMECTSRVQAYALA